MSTQITFFIAFVVVLALIGVAAWLVRRFAGNRLGTNTNRGRMPRLAVIDAAAVDGRRRLVLVRRDNVEHLLMIGGPSDIVIEPNILRATPVREPAPPRSVVGADGPPRVSPLPETTWEEEAPSPPSPSEPPPRPARPAFLDETRRPAPERREPPASPPRPEPRSDTPPPPPRAVPRNEPIPRPGPRLAEAPKSPSRGPAPSAPPSPQKVPANADQNLTEMAQRLEAALRRAPNAEANEPRVGAPPVQPDGPTRIGRNEAPAAAVAKKAGIDNLEDEMASLLGRPKSPS